MRVLYIAGEGRSGSTVLEGALGAVPGSFACGEIRFLFSKALRNDEFCGCRAPISQCATWRAIGERAFGGWTTPEAIRAGRVLTEVQRPRHFLELVRGTSPRVRDAVAAVERLYSAISTVTGTSVIVDSSKHPAWLYLLHHSDSIDLRVVHLVRHPAAVVHSWSRPKPRPHANGADHFIPRQGVAQVATRWAVFNTLIDRLGKRHPLLRIRYEDYVQSLPQTIRACAEHAGIASTQISQISHQPQHGVAGNPARFDPHASVVLDDRWFRATSTRQLQAIRVLTGNRTRAFGYAPTLRDRGLRSTAQRSYPARGPHGSVLHVSKVRDPLASTRARHLAEIQGQRFIDYATDQRTWGRSALGILGAVRAIAAVDEVQELLIHPSADTRANSFLLRVFAPRATL